MIENDTLARQLHDKATRGETLTTSEQARLEAWYAQQDAAENTMLIPVTASKTVRDLQSEVETASAQLLTVTQHIQALILENETLRQEIAALSEQLTPTASLQPA